MKHLIAAVAAAVALAVPAAPAGAATLLPAESDGREASAGFLLSPGFSSAGRAPAMASICVTFGPSWGQMGRYFSAMCYGGWGPFYVKSWCYNDDGAYRYTAVGSVAWVPYGISEGYCPFGTHPWHRWVVLL